MTFGYWSKVKAVDTVAAGDSFNGAIAEALSEGKSLHEAVLFGNAMGVLTVQKKEPKFFQTAGCFPVRKKI